MFWNDSEVSSVRREVLAQLQDSSVQQVRDPRRDHCDGAQDGRALESEERSQSSGRRIRRSQKEQTGKEGSVRIKMKSEELVILGAIGIVMFIILAWVFW